MSLKPTILVVDDYASTRNALSDLLSDDYEVLAAADGLEAMRCYAEHGSRIVAVITDVQMPRVNGRQLLEWLHQQAADLPVILMSGHKGQAAVEPLLQPGLVMWLRKPFDINDLLALLKRLVPPSTKAK